MEDNTSFQRTDRCTSTPHILVGVDDSPQSARAFDIALSLAKQRAWSLRLVSGYELLYSDFEAGDDILRDYSDAAIGRIPLEGCLACRHRRHSTRQ